MTRNMRRLSLSATVGEGIPTESEIEHTVNLMTILANGRKVLIVAKAYPPFVGGVESYSEFIARSYIKCGIEPVVVSAWDGPSGWTRRLYPEGPVRVLNLGVKNLGAKSQVTNFVKLILACARLISRERFDFFHPTTWRPALAILPWRKGGVMVLTVHGQEVLNVPKGLKRLMLHILKTSDLVVSVSPTTKRVAESVLNAERPKGQWESNFNGLSYFEEASAFVRVKQSMHTPVRILTFARLAERKNIQGCLRALAKIVEEGNDNFHYTIAGSGPMKEELQKLIRDLSLTEKVTMTGYVKEENIIDLYKNADIFLHPQTASKTGRDLEGFGLVIADAMSFGAAAIVGRDGGPSDFVKHGERGIVVDGNEVDEIAEALRSLLRDPGRLDVIAAEGRRWCLANLSWDRHVQQIVDNLSRRKLI